MQTLLKNGEVENFKRPEENHDASTLKRGDIISVVTHMRYRQPTIKSHHESVSYAGVYGAVHSKYRKMIVLERHAMHLACAPILTYGGTGGAGRGDMEQELINIRDRETYSPVEVDDLAAEVVFCDMLDGFQGNFVRGKCVIKVSERESVHVAEKVSLEGSISPGSAAFLSQKYLESLEYANRR